MTIYKNCDGRKIEKCKDCNYCSKLSLLGLFKKHFCFYGDPYCTVRIKNPNIIPVNCLLEDYKDENQICGTCADYFFCEKYPDWEDLHKEDTCDNWS